MFIKLFKNSMSEVNDYEKAYTIVNCLDTPSVELVVLHLLS